MTAWVAPVDVNFGGEVTVGLFNTTVRDAPLWLDRAFVPVGVRMSGEDKIVKQASWTTLAQLQLQNYGGDVRMSVEYERDNDRTLNFQIRLNNVTMYDFNMPTHRNTDVGYFNFMIKSVPAQVNTFTLRAKTTPSGEERIEITRLLLNEFAGNA